MESYKAEIAAYKLDRMLDMHMVPPIIERKIEGKNGAAVFWIENTRPVERQGAAAGARADVVEAT
jgi:hypothetical protein